MPVRPAAVLVALALASPLGLMATPASAVTVAKPYDFNADGYPELVVGAPGLSVGPRGEGGAVAVLPASKKGLSLEAQLITPLTPGVAGDPDSHDAFGAAFASGDFDGDGYADLAVGRPAAHLTVGAVTVLYGSAAGLSGKRSVELVEPGGPEEDARFGAALTVGDFDGDGRADLAVGAPGAGAIKGRIGGGTVSVFPGSPTGVSSTRSTVLHGQTEVPSPSDDFDDDFGATLAVGDLDQDGRVDLVVGARGSGFTDEPGSPGSVSACYGSPKGLGGCVLLDRRPAYATSSALAVGNVSGTSRPEVVLGAPRANPVTSPGGTVQILALSGARASTTVSRVELTQNSPGVPGSNEKDDDFGGELVLGDLDRDGFDDLVIGAQTETVGRRDAGRITVVHGGSTGYRRTGNRVYDESTKGVPGKAEDADAFGGGLALVDHDGDGHLDLAVGAPGEDDGRGVVTTLRGSGTSFTTKKARAFSLKDLGHPASFASFGAPLNR